MAAASVARTNSSARLRSGSASDTDSRGESWAKLFFSVTKIPIASVVRYCAYANIPIISLGRL